MEQPSPPYPGWLDELGQRIERDSAGAEPIGSPHHGAPKDVVDRVTAKVDDLAGDLVDLSHDIHAHPELLYEEHHAAETVAGLLGRHGYDAEVGAFGVDTAVHGRAGEGRPRVAVLAEYDALPGIGHGCGHNIICATAVGAFLALTDLVGDLDGSVELIGTPAEEGGGGKELIARAGGFDEVDAVVMLHPFGFDVGDHPWLGVRTVDVTYRGLGAHAAMMPFMGRNALDGVVTAYNSMAQLRQHLLPGDRVHGIITEGGHKPNLVPERAAAHYYLRSRSVDGLVVLVERATALFEAAASATGTVVDIAWDPTPIYVPVRSNAALLGRYAANAARRGRNVLPAGVVPADLAGSTDLGNVSVRVPAIHPTLAIAPPNVIIHTADFADHAIKEAADRGVLDGAVMLALTAADFLTDADLRADVAEEFEQAGGATTPNALFGED